MDININILKLKNAENLTLHDVVELSEQKQSYKPLKSQDPDTYGVFKRLLKIAREAWMPLRVVDVVKRCIKRGERCPEGIDLNPDTSLKNDKTDRKNYLESLQERLVKTAEQYPEEARLASSIKWLHGTNSAVLPLLPKTGCTFLPSGLLLNQGLAPMCGELFQGGMIGAGVNQKWLSLETIRDIKRVYKYATKESKTFDPKDYENPEKMFEENLNILLECKLEASGFDDNIIELTRMKQWIPTTFNNLCEKYAKDIERLFNELPQKFAADEHLILKALDYPLELLKKSQTDEQERKEVEEIFPVLEWTFGKWYFNDCGEDVISAILFQQLSGINPDWESILIKVVRARLFFETRIQKHDLSDKNSQRKILFNELLFEGLGLAPNPTPSKTITSDFFFDTLVRAPIEKRISAYQSRYETKINRLEKLFHQPVSEEFSHEERDMITNPFPIVIGSTKQKIQAHGNVEEFKIQSALLGREIDLLFVPEEKIDIMNTWLKTRNLSVQAFFLKKLLHLQQLTHLTHPPSSVILSEPLISYAQWNSLNDALTRFVFPLYRENHPNGEPKRFHGIPHAARALLFGGILMEIYAEEDKKITKKPRDLLMAIACHDIARGSDMGEDLWDRESGQKAAELLKKAFGLNEETSSFFEELIATKDENFKAVTEKSILHDADCLEIMRCLKNERDFDRTQLALHGLVSEERLHQFIQEVARFIKLTEQPKIKAFIEQAKDPFAVLVQILEKASQCSSLELLTNYSLTASWAFNDPSKYQLTSDLEKLIEQGVESHKSL